MKFPSRQAISSSVRRIKTLTLYYLWATKGNIARFLLMIIWPVFDLIIWGFTILYIQKNQTLFPNLLTLFLGAVILWSLLWRSQQEVSQQFMQDVFSRNFNNILITPVRLWEVLFALFLSSLVKLFLILSALYFTAYFFFSLIPFKINLWLFLLAGNLIIFGWVLGIIAISFVLRFGYRFDFLTWAFAFFLWPLSCVFYSRDSLPPFLKSLSFLIPPSYIFEGMREILLKENLWLPNLYSAIILNIIYILSTSCFFLFMLKWAKRSGNLAKI